MAYVDRKIEELKKYGVFGAERVHPDAIHKVLNMDEVEYYSIDILTLESYLGMLAQQAMYIQQEVNIAEAREIELGKEFKVKALPLVIDSKIRSVEERWIYASTLNDELKLKFDLWQNSIIEATLKKDLAKPVVEKLNVLKKIYDDRRAEGNNKNIHKYTEGN